MFRDWTLSDRINLGLGIFFFVAGVHAMWTAGDLGFALLFGILYGIVFGVTGGRVLMNHFIEGVVYGVSGMSDKTEPNPPQMEYLQGLIKQRRYEEAEPLLLDELNNFPKSINLLMLLAEVYVSLPGKVNDAFLLIESHFADADDRVEADISLLMLYADLCEDHNKLGQANELLETEYDSTKYSEVDLKSIGRRLEAINAMRS
mgnify:CR=1 FL=1